MNPHTGESALHIDVTSFVSDCAMADLHPRTGGMQGELLTLARHTLVKTFVVAAVALVLLFVWYASDLLLLAFASILFSILLRRLSRMMREVTGLGLGRSLILVLLSLLVILGLIGWFVHGSVAVEATELMKQLPVALENARARLEVPSGRNRRLDR